MSNYKIGDIVKISHVGLDRYHEKFGVIVRELNGTPHSHVLNIEGKILPVDKCWFSLVDKKDLTQLQLIFMEIDEAGINNNRQS